MTGVAPAGLDRSALDAQLLSSLEQHGPVSDVSGEEFQPALLPGGGGIAYQLLRMHPGSDLPSVLIPAGPAQSV